MIIKLPPAKLSGIMTVSKGVNPESMMHVSTFPNMILDEGLKSLATRNDYIKYCSVGSSGDAVIASQTQLINRLHTSSSLFGAEQKGASTTDPLAPYVYRRKTIRFPPKGTAYNVAEIGFGWDVNGLLFNRALVLDGSALPTVISVQGNEYLDVTYEVRLYPPMTDTTGTVTPTGKDTAVRSWTARAAGDGGVLTYSAFYGWSLEGAMIKTHTGVSINSCHTNGLAGIFNIPSGNIGGATAGSGIFDPTDVSIVYSTTMGLEEANSPLGVKTFVRSSKGPRFQIQFDPPFMKTNEDELKIDFKFSLGRK